MKILIIGGSGLVGSTLSKYARKNFEIHQTKNTNNIENNLPTSKIDLLTQSNKMLNLINEFKPNTVVHTAAFPSVDFCQTNPKMADLLHVEITEKITKSCLKNNSKLIYISTDAVFDGKLNRKYCENDKPNPLGHYGKTKLQAEEIILGASKDNVILRSTVIYGKHERSRFTNWVIGLLKEKKMVEAFTDQNNTPTLVDDIAKSILKIIDMKIGGLFHAVGKTCISRYEFARLLAKKYRLDENLIKPVTSQEKKQDAPRPVNGCLDNTKLENTIGFKFCSINDGIDFISKSQHD